MDLQYLVNEWSEIWEKELKEIDFLVIDFFYSQHLWVIWLYWWYRLLVTLWISRLRWEKDIFFISLLFSNPHCYNSRIKFKRNGEVQFFLFYLEIPIVSLEVAKKCTERFCVSFILFFLNDNILHNCYAQYQNQEIAFGIIHRAY